jgi:hypothetical protein
MGMFKKKNDLTTDDAPDSIAPWVMLDESEMASIAAKIKKGYPDQNYVPVARREGSDLRVCFDKGVDGKGKTLVLVHESGGPVVKNYNGFADWFDEAVAEARKQ